MIKNNKKKLKRNRYRLLSAQSHSTQRETRSYQPSLLWPYAWHKVTFYSIPHSRPLVRKYSMYVVCFHAVLFVSFTLYLFHWLSLPYSGAKYWLLDTKSTSVTCQCNSPQNNKWWPLHCFHQLVVQYCWLSHFLQHVQMVIWPLNVPAAAVFIDIYNAHMLSDYFCL